MIKIINFVSIEVVCLRKFATHVMERRRYLAPIQNASMAMYILIVLNF